MKSLQLTLVYDEGVRLRPYHDTVGKLTIGVGRNIEDRGITMATALQMLQEDMTEALKDCHDIFGSDWIETAGHYRVVAVVNMLFNLGRSRFLGFTKMIAHLKTRQFEAAAMEAKDSLWFRQVKRRGLRIVQMIAENRLPDEYRIHQVTT